MKSYKKHHLKYILNEELTKFCDQWKVEDKGERIIEVASKAQETLKIKIHTINKNKKFGKRR